MTEEITEDGRVCPRCRQRPLEGNYTTCGMCRISRKHSLYTKELSEFERQEIQALEGHQPAGSVARDFGVTIDRVREVWSSTDRTPDDDDSMQYHDEDDDEFWGWLE